MKPFRYATALSAERAVELVGDAGRFFAGGVDVLGEMKDGLAAPGLLVNVKQIPGTQAIEANAGGWTIGANVRLADLAAAPEVRARLRGLAEAADAVGSPQIRNVATVGGNLAQHARCWYYRHPDVECLKKGGDRCYARRGRNRHHSLFTGNTCLSPLVSNLAVALAALDARAVVYRDGTRRALTMAELYAAAWDDPTAHHSLGATDLILAVEVPAAATASTYLQLGEKQAFDWALVSCAAAARVEDGVLHAPRVVLGAVAPVPYRRDDVDALLDGRPLTPELAARAADLLLDDARPRSDNGFKVPIAKALVRRALLQLT